MAHFSTCGPFVDRAILSRGRSSTCNRDCRWARLAWPSRGNWTGSSTHSSGNLELRRVKTQRRFSIIARGIAFSRRPAGNPDTETLHPKAKRSVSSGITQMRRLIRPGGTPHPTFERGVKNFATISAACPSTKGRASARTVVLRHSASDPQWLIPIGLPDEWNSASFCNRNGGFGRWLTPGSAISNVRKCC